MNEEIKPEDCPIETVLSASPPVRHRRYFSEPAFLQHRRTRLENAWEGHRATIRRGAQERGQPAPASRRSPAHATAARLHRVHASITGSRRPGGSTGAPSPPIPSPPGGNAKVRVAGVVFRNFWFWRTQAAATVALPGAGRLKSRLSCAMHSASPLRSLTTLPAPPNGIPSSIVYSPRSPKTGLPSHWTAMKECSNSFVPPVPKPAWL